MIQKLAAGNRADAVRVACDKGLALGCLGFSSASPVPPGPPGAVCWRLPGRWWLRLVIQKLAAGNRADVVRVAREKGWL
ncbi:hypothetical protein [Streptomyces sp. NPDC021622]|uniref:hypothetical protein n=1 Tax=Streptomyces sp. NPDC021622 TaxID=3155013 RepID=UPI0033FFE2D3